jgi:hypothetical protein
MPDGVEALDTSEDLDDPRVGCVVCGVSGYCANDFTGNRRTKSSPEIGWILRCSIVGSAIKSLIMCCIVSILGRARSDAVALV